MRATMSTRSLTVSKSPGISGTPLYDGGSNESQPEPGVGRSCTRCGTTLPSAIEGLLTPREEAFPLGGPRRADRYSPRRRLGDLGRVAVSRAELGPTGRAAARASAAGPF